MRVQQPCAAGCVETFMDWLKRNPAPVIMVTRHAEHWRFDAGQNLQRFVQIFLVLYDVAGKTHKIGRE